MHKTSLFLLTAMTPLMLLSNELTLYTGMGYEHYSIDESDTGPAYDAPTHTVWLLGVKNTFSTDSERFRPYGEITYLHGTDRSSSMLMGGMEISLPNLGEETRSYLGAGIGLHHQWWNTDPINNISAEYSASTRPALGMEVGFKTPLSPRYDLDVSLRQYVYQHTTELKSRTGMTEVNDWGKTLLSVGVCFDW